MPQFQTQSGPFRRIMERIDAFNRQDPHLDNTDGVEQAHEYVYSLRVSAWVNRLNPAASDELRIAARGQHVGRWEIPRERYPMDRGGYLRWREDLKRFHADTVARFLNDEKYDAEFTERVRNLILKKNIKGDPDTQTLEDALCLVFLETQFEPLRLKTPEDKMVEILRKTWRKMSPHGRRSAEAIELSAAQQELLKRALADTAPGGDVL